MYQKPNTIVYLRRTGIVIAGRKLTPARVTFEPAEVSNMEVINHDKLTDECEKFFNKHGLKHRRILLVLDSSIVFTKSALLDSTKQPSELIDAFVAAMPFNPGQRAVVSDVKNNELTLYATNFALYDAVREALHATGGARVVAITPSAAYDMPGNEQTSGTAVDKFLSNVSVSKTFNFLRAQVS